MVLQMYPENEKEEVVSTSMDLAEDHRHNKNEFTVYEKVLAAARRAKDLHNEGRVPLVKIPMEKAPLLALAELQLDKIAISQEEMAPSPLKDPQVKADSGTVADAATAKMNKAAKIKTETTAETSTDADPPSNTDSQAVTPAED